MADAEKDLVVQKLIELNKQRMARERAQSFLESVLFLVLSLGGAWVLCWAGLVFGNWLQMDPVAGAAVFVGPAFFFLSRYCLRMMRARLALLRLLNQLATSRDKSAPGPKGA